jgi:acyl-CoA thioesterase-1
MTMTPGNKYPNGHKSYRKNIESHYEMYRAVAKQRGFLLIELYSNCKAQQSKDNKLFLEYVPDTIHPTATGCSKIVSPVILDALESSVSK